MSIAKKKLTKHFKGKRFKVLLQRVFDTITFMKFMTACLYDL